MLDKIAESLYYLMPLECADPIPIGPVSEHGQAILACACEEISVRCDRTACITDVMRHVSIYIYLTNNKAIVYPESMRDLLKGLGLPAFNTDTPHL